MFLRQYSVISIWTSHLLDIKLVVSKALEFSFQMKPLIPDCSPLSAKKNAVFPILSFLRWRLRSLCFRTNAISGMKKWNRLKIDPTADYNWINEVEQNSFFLLPVPQIPFFLLCENAAFLPLALNFSLLTDLNHKILLSKLLNLRQFV